MRPLMKPAAWTRLFFCSQNVNYCKHMRLRALRSLPGGLRLYLPHILVAVITISIVGASYASVVASSSSPKAIWSTSPITITFSHITGTGSATDSFKCAPPYLNPVVLSTTVDKPLLVSLTTSPSSFPACGPSFTTFTLTSHSAIPGTYTGTVTVRQGSLYGTAIPPSLIVNIVVT